MEPDRKIMRQVAKAKINGGTSKQRTYEELTAEFKNRNIAAEVVRYVPSLELRRRYDWLNIVCLVVLGLVALVKVAAQAFGGILWIGFMIYAVADRQYKYYYWLIILGILSLVGSVVVYFTKPFHGSLDLPALCIDGGVALLFLFFGIFIPSVMAPPYEEKKQFYTNAKGQKKIMVVHVFKGEESSSGTLDDIFTNPS